MAAGRGPSPPIASWKGPSGEQRRQPGPRWARVVAIKHAEIDFHTYANAVDDSSQNNETSSITYLAPLLCLCDDSGQTGGMAAAPIKRFSVPKKTPSSVKSQNYFPISDLWQPL